jgi:hypothetical protein
MHFPFGCSIAMLLHVKHTVGVALLQVSQIASQDVQSPFNVI